MKIIDEYIKHVWHCFLFMFNLRISAVEAWQWIFESYGKDISAGNILGNGLQSFNKGGFEFKDNEFGRP